MGQLKETKTKMAALPRPGWSHNLGKQLKKILILQWIKYILHPVGTGVLCIVKMPWEQMYMFNVYSYYR